MNKYEPKILTPSVLKKLVNMCGAVARNSDEQFQSWVDAKAQNNLSYEEGLSLRYDLLKDNRLSEEDIQFIKDFSHNPNVGDNVIFELMELKRNSNDFQIRQFSDFILKMFFIYSPELFEDVNHQGVNVIHKAAEYGYHYVAELVQNGIDMGTIAPSFGYNSVVGSDASEEFAGKTPLHFVAKSGIDHRNSIFSGIDIDLDLNAKDANGQTALHIASENGNHPFLNHYIKSGIDFDVNAQDVYGNTLVHYAAYGYSAELIGMLVERGANLLIPNNSGLTPYDMSCELGNDFIIERYVKAITDTQKCAAESAEKPDGECTSYDNAGEDPSELNPTDGYTPNGFTYFQETLPTDA